MTQTFENFRIHDGTRYAYAASKAASERLLNAYNPLFLWGEAGSGKSHLLNAMAAYTKSLRNSAKIKRVDHASMTFAPHADMILLDDARESSMRKLIDLVDLTKAQVVIASREKPPSDLTEPFGYGLVVQMERA